MSASNRTAPRSAATLVFHIKANAEANSSSLGSDERGPHSALQTDPLGDF